MFKNQVFWKEDFNGKAKGGVFFRSFDLNKFMERVESSDEEVVGYYIYRGNVFSIEICQVRYES